MDPEPSSFLTIFLFAFNSQTLLQIGLIVLLLIASGIISASEVAFFSLSKKELEDEKENFVAKIEKIQLLLKDKKSLLSTILILNNFINIAVVILLASLTSDFIFTELQVLNLFTISDFAIKMTFDLGVTTFLILLFGEIIPKVYAQKNALSLSIKMIDMIAVFKKILSPISIPLISLTKFIEKNIKAESFSVDQLSHALEITSDDDDTSDEEQKILKGIVNFGNTLAKEIMTPRVDMFAIEKNTDFETVIEKIKENGYSRIPIYDENEDTICGILYAKDLINHLDTSDFNWNTVYKKPLFVPENKKLDDLLADFQRLKTHIAIVVDEYGGTSGLISLEDILEEIVGEISDEFDDDALNYTIIDKQTFIFEGKTPIKDFLRVIEADNEVLIEDAKGEAETIAGFILEQLDDFPKKNQKLKFHNFTFLVEAITKKRIKRVKVFIDDAAENLD